MHSQTIIITLLTWTAGLALASPTPLTVRTSIKEIDGLPIVPMQWVGSISDGSNVSLSGTIESIKAQLLKLDPAYDLTTRAAEFEKRDELAARTITSLTCNIPQDYVEERVSSGQYPMEDAIRYLKSVGGGCYAAAGACVRVSCSYNSAVYLCNGNNYAIAPACGWIGANMVQEIVNRCTTNVEGPFAYYGIRGKDWDSDNYSVTVQKDSC